ncbi:MAG: hypothetical protein KOO66_12345 [Bacteroidales bacterium]|nr:hypothetical protein [Bacteroidales bacterium]
MKNLYFTSPEKSVEIITELLKNKDWEELTNYYYLKNCNQSIIDSMLSGDYFIRKDKPEIAHPGGFWKFKNPFPPGFKYSFYEELEDNIILVNLTIEIDQGDNNIQEGRTFFQLIKFGEGYQLIP